MQFKGYTLNSFQVRAVHAEDPGVLGPIEEAFDVRVGQRLGDDGVWSTLAR